MSILISIVNNVKERIHNILLKEIKEKVNKEMIKVEIERAKPNVLAFIPLHFLNKMIKEKEKREDILKKIEEIKSEEYIIKIDGMFANIIPTNKFFGKIVDEIRELKDEGRKERKENKKEKIIVDFSSPNIAKPMNVGHFRSTILGESLCRLEEFKGGEVVRTNYLGDWGLQFGKLLVAYELWGTEDRLRREGIKYLFELYVKYHKEAEKEKVLEEKARKAFSELERGNKKYIELWEMFRRISIEEFKKMYTLLGIEFDEYKGESHYNQKAKEVIKEILEKGIGKKEEDGTVVVELKRYNMPNLVVYKGGEHTLYSTRDLAAIKERKKTADKIWYVVGNEQKQYFEQMFKVAELLGYIKEGDGEHISFGLLELDEGKMSSRKGRVILAEEIVNKGIEKGIEIVKEKGFIKENKKIEDVGKKVALASIKYAIFSQARRKNIIFNYDKFISFEGETGAYISYTYARANSLLRKYKEEGKTYDNVKEVRIDEVKRIFILFSKYIYYIDKSYENRDPHYLALYTMNICKEFNKIYQKIKFIGNRRAEEDGYILSRSFLRLMDLLLWILNIEKVKEM